VCKRTDLAAKSSGRRGTQSKSRRIAPDWVRAGPVGRVEWDAIRRLRLSSEVGGESEKSRPFWPDLLPGNAPDTTCSPP
jgi:hypothetical protein